MEPSSPAGDAPCPCCGSLLWFSTPDDFDIAEMPTFRISLRFHGGCREGRIVAKDPKRLSESHGYRYCLLAWRGEVGMSWREVPVAEYPRIQEVLDRYGSESRLSDGEIQEILRQLKHIRSHVYTVRCREQTPEEIAMVLDFVRADTGI